MSAGMASILGAGMSVKAAQQVGIPTHWPAAIVANVPLANILTITHRIVTIAGMIRCLPRAVPVASIARQAMFRGQIGLPARLVSQANMRPQ